MHEIIKNLLNSHPVITDGAWGTELQKQGLKPGESPEALNLERPEIVEAVAKSYVEAGSRIIITNTFGGTRFTLERHGLADQVAEVNRAGAAISKHAAGDQTLVFASVGPTGKMLMMGDVTEEELLSAFSEQAQALAAGGADGLVIETMSDLEEAKIALQACKATGLPVVASMVYDAGADFDKLCAKMKAHTALPIWIKGNAGLPEMVDGKAIYKTTPEEFVSYAQPLLEAGADFIGGCCGTSPDFIRALKKTTNPK